MACTRCGSSRQGKFVSEVALHLPPPKGLNSSAVFILTTLLICLDCGLVEFTVPKDQLQLLAQGSAAQEGRRDSRIESR
jgi:hypothetical protein